MSNPARSPVRSSRSRSWIVGVLLGASMAISAPGCPGFATLDWGAWASRSAAHCVTADGVPVVGELASRLLGEVVSAISGGVTFDGPAWKATLISLGLVYGIDCLRHAAADLIAELQRVPDAGGLSVASAGGMIPAPPRRAPPGARSYLLRAFGSDLGSGGCP